MARIVIDVPDRYAGRVRDMFASGARGFYGRAAADGRTEPIRALVDSILAQLGESEPVEQTLAQRVGEELRRELGAGWWVRPESADRVVVHGPNGATVIATVNDIVVEFATPGGDGDAVFFLREEVAAAPRLVAGAVRHDLLERTGS